MNLIQPKKLKFGDTIGLLSASGIIRDISLIENSAKYFQKYGFKTIISESSYKKFRYCAGSDEDRLNEIHKFFLDDNINAIVCTRGGYGLLRIIDKLDYNIVINHPKILCGYSDITSLLLMLYKKTGMVCFHGAMTCGDFGYDNVSDFTENSFWNTLTGKDLHSFVADNNGKIIRKGFATGTLWGGNLATIASMIGLDFIPDEKFVLFIEDVNEPAYKIDRMLTQLFNCEKFAENTVGIAVGEFSDVDRMDYVEDILSEISQKYQLPCCNGFKISHDKEKITLPIGVKCNFSADDKIITISDKVFQD